RQEQLAIEQAVKIVVGIGQMDGDDAVIGLARCSAPLPLDSWRFFSLLGTTRLVNNPDAVRSSMFAGDEALQLGLHQTMIPIQQAQKLLERPRWHSSRVGNRLAVLPRQVGKLAFDVYRQMPARVASQKAVVELLQELSQPRPQRTNLLGIHARISWSNVRSFIQTVPQHQYQIAL